MNHRTRNAIAWNRNQIRRSLRLKDRARNDDQRAEADRNIARFERNIEQLQEAA